MKKVFSTLLLFALTTLISHGHCQIPCGIYGDETRFTTLLEHVATIRKSVAQITEESEKEKPNYNQLVRWVNNKETHADAITTIVTEYFLAQRIKRGQEHYNDKLALLHDMIVFSMKTKQSLDPSNVDKLEMAVKQFEDLYLHHKH